jgi:uncharacterized LabA/DUF88 family protein
MSEEQAADRKAQCRVGVFIDWQNCYRTARDAFGFRGAGLDGNVKPLLFARALAASRLPEQGAGQLTRLRIYTGQASQHHDKRTYAANRRQFQAWRNSDPEIVEVIARTLDYKLGRAREKGIDVKLAIDLVRSTLMDEEHDVAVVVSADTDLVPALELVVEQRGAQAVEVATWSGPNWSPAPLAIAGMKIRQHQPGQAVYNKVQDRVDYGAPAADASSQSFGGHPRFPAGRRPRQG